MAETNFPNGVSIPAGHVGNVTPNVIGTGKREAWGTVVVPSGAGGTQIASGLTTVEFVQASPYNAGAAVAGYAGVHASSPGGGSVLLIGVSSAGTASTASGTATWRAVGT